MVDINVNTYPFVSIIVPVFNGERTIARCAESLIVQDYPQERYEVLVVDNGSTDRTREILSNYPAKLLSETNIQSSYAARNRGIEAARGEFLAFTDSDCIADKRWIIQLIGGFTGPEIGGVAGKIEGVKSENSISRYVEKKRIHGQEQFVQGVFCLPFAATGNVMYRRIVFEEIGLFDETFYSGGDVELGLRMSSLTKWKYHYQPQALVKHPHNDSLRTHFRQSKRYATGHVHLAKKHPQIWTKRSSLYDLSWTYRVIFRRLWKATKTWYTARKTDCDPMLYMEDLLDAITSLAFQLGHLRGSIKHRYWYM